MYLEKRPTIFTKDGQIREVFHTWVATELRAAGWTVQGEEEPSMSDVQDAPNNNNQEQEGDEGYDIQSDDSEDLPDLSAMTKAQLVAYADEVGIKIDPHTVKSNIISTIEESFGEIERV